MIIVFIILVIVAIAVDIFIATVWQSVATKKVTVTTWLFGSVFFLDLSVIFTLPPFTN